MEVEKPNIVTRGPLKCEDCGAEFVFSSEELQWYPRYQSGSSKISVKLCTSCAVKQPIGLTQIDPFHAAWDRFGYVLAFAGGFVVKWIIG